MQKLGLHFLSTIRLNTYVFSLSYLLYLTLRVILPKTMRATCLHGGCSPLLAFYLCLSALIYGCFSSVSYASSPLANDVHVCEVLDYEDIRARDSLYVATKQALDLNVGEPRTVRMIYFLPNDRPFQQAVIDSMKVTIRQIQTFFADQMEAHGYGRKTFRFETDAHGDPVVHRLDGQHPDNHYDGVGHWDEIREKFDTRGNNVYLVVADYSTLFVPSGGGGRNRGFAQVNSRF